MGGEGERRKRRVCICIAVLATALSLGRHAAIMDAPFNGLEGLISGRITGSIVLQWNKSGGIGAMEGRPTLETLPTSPPEGISYGSHPPAAFWLAYSSVAMQGLSERSIRFWFIVATACLGGCLAFLVAAHGVWPGLAAAVLWSVLPMTTIYGQMAGYEPLIALLSLVGSWLLLRGKLCCALTLLFACCLTDWPGFFLGFAWCAAVGVGWVRGLASKARAMKAISLTLALAGVSIVGLFIYWDGVRSALTQLSAAAYRGAGSNLEDLGIHDITVTSWLAAQTEHLESLFGLPILGCAVFGMGLVFIRWGKHAPKQLNLGRLCMILGFMGMVNLLIFYPRAFDHEFWSYYLAAPICILAALVPSLAKSRRAQALLSLVVIAVGLWTGLPHWHADKPSFQQAYAEAMQMDMLFGPTDLVVTDGRIGSWRLWCDAWIYHAFPHEIETAIEAFATGRTSEHSRLIVVCKDPTDLRGLEGIAQGFNCATELTTSPPLLIICN